MTDIQSATSSDASNPSDPPCVDVVTNRDEESFTRVLNGFSDESLSLYFIYNLLEHKERSHTVSVCALRLAHFRSVFNKINILHDGPELACNFLSAVERELIESGTVDAVFNPDDDGGTQFEIARALFRLSPKRSMRILKSIEKDSQGQSRNPVWYAIRADTVSATRFYDVYSSCKLDVLCGIDENSVRRGCEAVRFGVQCEPIVRTVLEEFVTGRRDVCGDIGVLLDPSSGVLGASLDFCVGICRDDDGLLNVSAGAAIFEIKCRFKYLRTRDDVVVKDLIDNPNLRTFAALILSHDVPAVEFRQPGEVPTARESLVSYDKVFRRDRKRRRSGIVPKVFASWIDGLLEKNADVVSKVFVFDTRRVSRRSSVTSKDSSDNGDDEYLELINKAIFTAPIFINPRHSYYCQTLLQQYILSQYYINAHHDPERMSSNELPSVTLVSAILRKRAESERGKIIRINGRRSDCEEIPLCLILTPVRLDPLFTRDAVTCVLNTWERDVSRKVGIPLWVHNSVNEYVAACIPRAPTP
nr:deoxyribonuclease [Mastomys natalensis cytomegalovirus 3]WEG69924.1 deoxyribonuclease [Mastomys natalensis cytomegalovirus 3]WEG70064.1 deoxyribonuclease [Mastomys natalensis cytomegalovirus 3]WEG70204.1 deoxyribonuclease [Mastomys natalensis cytomegalovirus 3]WEG70344.1 deoxyribonuclease [Mastomys natalensis cytomegalovirus 3]